MADPRDAFGIEDTKIHRDEGDGFIRFTIGRNRLAFPTTRELTAQERDKLAQWEAAYDRQLRGGA